MSRPETGIVWRNVPRHGWRARADLRSFRRPTGLAAGFALARSWDPGVLTTHPQRRGKAPMPPRTSARRPGPNTLRRSPRPDTRIESAIRLVRGQRVLLDVDLAELYEVRTRALVQATKRNAARFPSDFMFQLTPRESADLRSQNVISSTRGQHGGRRYRSYVFTEQGVAMLSSVLRSRRAIAVAKDPS